MKPVDLSPIKEMDVQYEKIVTTLQIRFKCDWDDKVHESYGRFVRQLQELSRETKTIRCKAERLEKEVEELGIEELSRQAESLCREADTV